MHRATEYGQKGGWEVMVRLGILSRLHFRRISAFFALSEAHILGILIPPPHHHRCGMSHYWQPRLELGEMPHSFRSKVSFASQSPAIHPNWRTNTSLQAASRSRHLSGRQRNSAVKMNLFHTLKNKTNQPRDVNAIFVDNDPFILK